MVHLIPSLLVWAVYTICCMLHAAVAQPKLLINQFELVYQSRQEALGAYFTNINIVFYDYTRDDIENAHFMSTTSCYLPIYARLDLSGIFLIWQKLR